MPVVYTPTTNIEAQMKMKAKYKSSHKSQPNSMDRPLICNKQQAKGKRNVYLSEHPLSITAQANPSGMFIWQVDSPFQEAQNWPQQLHS